MPKKGSYFQCKTDKIDTNIEFCLFELVFVSNFTLDKQFCIFGQNLLKKDIYGQKQKNWTSSLNSAYQISLGNKFLLKLKILISWTRFTQEGFFWSKIEKVNTTTEFCIFKLV